MLPNTFAERAATIHSSDLKSNRTKPCFPTLGGSPEGCYGPSVRSLLWGAVLICGGLTAAPAHAYEDQLTLGAGAGYGYSASREWPRHAALFDVSVSVGLSPSLALRGHAGYGFHPDDEPLHGVIAGADLLYLIDVVEIVPYFGLGVSGLGRIRGGDFHAAAAAQLVLGFDYHLDRDLALELDVRPYLLVTDLDREPLFLSALVSLIWLLDA